VDFWDSGGTGALAAYKEGDRAWNSEIASGAFSTSTSFSEMSLSWFAHK